jgi:signal transduction histidine kinase
VVASVRPEGDQVVLEVADRGPGVPANRRDRVFERFARSDSGRTATGGSGLGLAIVRAVAEAHGGAVQLHEAEGGGASFTVALPALVAQPTPAPGVVGSETEPTPREPKGAETT